MSRQIELPGGERLPIPPGESIDFLPEERATTNPVWSALAYLLFVVATILLAVGPALVWAAWRWLL
jgi:hypothetical protein